LISTSLCRFKDVPIVFFSYVPPTVKKDPGCFTLLRCISSSGARSEPGSRPLLTLHLHWTCPPQIFLPRPYEMDNLPAEWEIGEETMAVLCIRIAEGTCLIGLHTSHRQSFSRRLFLMHCHPPKYIYLWFHLGFSKMTNLERGM
jgi:hypothetical protein